MKDGVIDLGSKRACDPALAGGKAAGLARLNRFGFNVPAGFVVGSCVFEDTIRAVGIPPISGRSDLSARDLDSLRRRLRAGKLPKKWRHKIAGAYRKLGGRVAVRSSMVGEDGLHRSLAGQLASCLDVEGESALFDAISECYASVFSTQLHDYLAGVGRGAEPDRDGGFAMAVLVQRMIPSPGAGVAFTADPETGERCVIIEAAPGRSDAVESGTVEPMRRVVDARGVLVDSGFDPAPDGFIRDDDILRLAGLVRGIAGRLGGPQDVEWILDGDEFWFLQARPITTLTGKRVYSNRLVADMSPGLVKPLLWSTNTLSMTRNVFGTIFSELIGTNDIDYSALSRRIHSRVYTDMTLLGELLKTVGLPSNLFEMMARDEIGERPPIRPSVTRLLRNGRLLKFLWRQTGSKKTIAAFADKQNKDLDTHRRADLSEATLPELLRRLDELMELHGRSQWHVFGAALNMMIRKRLLDGYLKRSVPGVTSPDLLRGLSGLKSFEPNRHFAEMAAIARKLDDGRRELVSSADDQSIRAGLSDDTIGKQLLDKADRFLAEYGFLSANGTDFSTESWVERPDLVWQSVARMARRSPGGREGGPIGAATDASGQVARELGPFRRRVFEKLLQSTIDYMTLRERTSLLLSEDAFQMRRVLLAIGLILADRGVLDRADDIFYLYIDELRSFSKSAAETAEAQRLVMQRREEMERDAKIDPPETICGETPPPSMREFEGRDYLVGIGGSAGVVEGRAVVVLDPNDAPPDLNKQDILVVPYTDVGWTPLFAGIGGIVAETGGQLSHTSIVAREYNLPAVVSVRGATRLLKNGQPVTLDGRLGRVYLKTKSSCGGDPK
jgi:pyruvate,water dikinase